MISNVVAIRISRPKTITREVSKILASMRNEIEKCLLGKKSEESIRQYAIFDVDSDVCEVDVFINGGMYCTVRETAIFVMPAARVAEIVSDVITIYAAENAEKYMQKVTSNQSLGNSPR